MILISTLPISLIVATLEVHENNDIITSSLTKIIVQFDFPKIWGMRHVFVINSKTTSQT